MRLSHGGYNKSPVCHSEVKPINDNSTDVHKNFKSSKNEKCPNQENLKPINVRKFNFRIFQILDGFIKSREIEQISKSKLIGKTRRIDVMNRKISPRPELSYKKYSH